MKYPKTILIGGQPHSLEFVKLNDKWGEYDPQRMVIRISDRLASPAAAETICHEILHTLFGLAGLSKDKRFEKLEEDVCVRTASYFLLWIKENKELIACLQGAMES